MADSPTPAAPPTALDRDLYCLTCGYNLRGLTGDPVRCPECGHLNPIGDVEIPAPIIAAQLRRMETSPALCVAAVLFGAPLLAALGAVLWEALRAHASGTEDVCCPGALTLLPVITWFYSVGSFRNSCLGKPGWIGALVMYHVWGLLLIGTTIGVPVLVFVLLLAQTRRVERLFSGALSVTYVVCCGGLVAVFVCWVPWAYRRATAALAPLQREVAVSIAREEIRKKMARERRGLLG